jgi:putative copper export protein
MFTKEVILWLHVILASFWVGGMIFLSLVVVPYVKDKPFRNEAFQEVGRRFSLYGTAVTLALLFITGVANAYLLHGGLERRTLKEKMILFLIVVAVSLAHDLWAGKRAVESEYHRRWAKVLGILNLFLGLIMVYMGVRIRLGL